MHCKQAFYFLNPTSASISLYWCYGEPQTRKRYGSSGAQIHCQLTGIRRALPENEVAQQQPVDETPTQTSSTNLNKLVCDATPSDPPGIQSQAYNTTSKCGIPWIAIVTSLEIKTSCLHYCIPCSSLIHPIRFLSKLIPACALSESSDPHSFVSIVEVRWDRCIWVDCPLWSLRCITCSLL